MSIFRLSHVRLLTSSPSFSPQKPVQHWPPLHTVRGAPQSGLRLHILVLQPPAQAGLPPWLLLPLLLPLGPVTGGGGQRGAGECSAQPGCRSAQAGAQWRQHDPGPECGRGAQWRGLAHGQAGRGGGRGAALSLRGHWHRVRPSEAGAECPQLWRGREPGGEAGWRGAAAGLALSVPRPPGRVWPRGLHQGGPGPAVHHRGHHCPDRGHLGLLSSARQLPRWVTPILILLLWLGVIIQNANTSQNIEYFASVSSTTLSQIFNVSSYPPE